MEKENMKSTNKEERAFRFVQKRLSILNARLDNMDENETAYAETLSEAHALSNIWSLALRGIDSTLHPEITSLKTTNLSLRERVKELEAALKICQAFVVLVKSNFDGAAFELNEQWWNVPGILNATEKALTESVLAED
jgi:hypothetical protein